MYYFPLPPISHSVLSVVARGASGGCPGGHSVGRTLNVDVQNTVVEGRLVGSGGPRL